MDPLFHKFGFGVKREMPYDAVHHAFEHHARLQPHALAVEHLHESITYEQLDKAANRLAHRLRARGVLPGSRVCLLVQRSISMVVAILATLKAGAAYVPLDGGIVTDSTLDHVLHDSAAVLTLALSTFVHRVQDRNYLCLETVIAQDEADDADCSKPPDLTSPRDGVYVIYTSGTTGKPKGVDVMHRNVVNLVCLSPGNVGMRPGLRVAQLLNIAFDMCAWEVLGSLANGCTLVLRGKTAAEWKAVMKTVHVVIATPSVLGQYDPADYPNIKFAATAGEVCPQSLADAWSKTGQFFNSCGPTEITIVNTVQPHTLGAPLSIGVPTPNNNVYVLDEHRNPLPIGEPGLMWAGGAGITRGYINLPDKTAERYCLDPFANDGSMMFNTGDIGRWRADGQLEHLGRADDQVKVKGFRVELDGVGAAMETCSSVKVATALLIGKDLWGFFTPATTSPSEVKVAAAKIQPYYAVPSRYMALPEFPHTANGKIDKRALRRLAEMQIEQTAAAALAATANEKTHARRSSAHTKPLASTSHGHAHGSFLVAGHIAKRSISEHGTAQPSAGPSRLLTLRAPVSVDLTSTSSPSPQVQFQACKCEQSPLSSQIHTVAVSVSGLDVRRRGVEVLSIHPTKTDAWVVPTDPGRTLEVGRRATCVFFIVGGHIKSSSHLKVSSLCLGCNGWALNSTSSLSKRADAPRTIAKELITDLACTLMNQSGVDIVRIVSDSQTSHAVVNEFGHRGVPVVLQAVN
ncbi:acetyl-CoA synthetase-like protein [Exidia glandulosa HHB12029]|uniref:Acetyl-CoA synthetase-like protein n=1 Tax=Exidia glandulosa HHB12029 TaxID=1314781 RepID=A0A165FE83_EXIGL|nr:acetyl-CoA synthetase-like protein [Exidia glandulosa HHB12029]